MAFKFWCVAPSHPLVKQVADKYGLTKKKAKTIINKARQNNPALNDDDLSLEDIEDDNAFKEALGEYVQLITEKQDVLLDDVQGAPKSRDDMRKELEDEELGLTQQQIEDILDRRAELGTSVNTSHVSSNNIARILKVFKNTKRLDVIGEYICRRSQEIVTLLETNPEFRQAANISEKETRKAYFLDEDSSSFVREKVIDDLNLAIDNVVDGTIGQSDPEQFISELETAIDNYHTLLYMYGGNMFRDEGVEVTPPGLVANSDYSSSSEERNDTDDADVNDSEDDTEEEKKVYDFSASKQNQSVSSKIVPTIKVLLSNCRELDANGEDIYDDENYGFPKYISVPHAVATLLNTCNGCQTFEEMRKAIESAQNSHHWMKQLLDALDTEYEYSENGITKSSSSRKEQLQTMFFQSVRKQFMPFKHTYITYVDGYMCFANADSNVSHQYDRIMRNVRTRFFRMSGLPILKNGQISFSTIEKIGKDCNKVIVDSSVASSEILRALRNNDKGKKNAAIEDLSKVEETMRGLLNDMGIKVSKKVFNDFLSKPMEYAANISDEDPTVAKYRLRTFNLSKVAEWTKTLTENFAKWHKFMSDNDVNDNPSSNPFSGKRGAVTFTEVVKIRNVYENIAQNLSNASPDSYESMARMAQKSYYSWNNPSSIQTIIESLSRDDRAEYMRTKYGADSVWYLKPESTDDKLVFYSDALNRIYNGQNIEYAEKPIVNNTEYEDIPDLTYALAILNDYFDNKGERDKSRAWYKTLIPSDKPRYGMVKLWRHNYRRMENGQWVEDDYHNVIARKAVDYFAQELRRSENVARDNALKTGVRFDGYDPKRTDDVKAVYAKMKAGEKITHSDVVKNGKYIFRGSGVSFYLNKFINDEIEGNTELGQYVIDKIFNSHLSNSEVNVIDESIMGTFKEAFHKYMAKTKREYVDQLDKIGAFEAESKSDEDGDVSTHARFLRGNLVRWHSDDEHFFEEMYVINEDKAKAYALEKDNMSAEDFDKNLSRQPYYKEIATFLDDVEEFVYNNWLAKVDMSEIFDVDLAFYGDTSNFQKRNAQVVSSGYPIDPDAKLHGQRVTDGKYRTITIKTTKIPSKHITNVEVALTQLIDNLNTEDEKRQFSEGIRDVVSGLQNFDPTDGQGLTSLTGLRKRMVGLGEWSRSNSLEEDVRGYTEDEHGNRTFIYTDEAVYQRFKRLWQKQQNKVIGETVGEYDEEAKAKDLLHVFAQTQKPFVYTFANVMRNGRMVTVPVQLKNSEYALTYIAAFMQTLGEKDSQLAAIAQFLEDTAEEDDTKGIDTANFDSVVKIGNNDRSIDLGNKNAKQTYAALEKACYSERKASKKWMKYTPGAVIEYDVQDYKIVQQKPEHFKHNQQPLGSQLKMLAINNIPLNATIAMPNGEQITGRELRDRYFDALRRKYENSEWNFRRMLGLDAPESVRKNKISNMLKSAMATDQRFTVEMRRGMSIVNRDGLDQFVIPLDEPGQQGAVESMLFSKIRKTFYKEKTNGGVVVQATSWGEADDLYIRFKSTNEDDIKNNNGLLQTIDQFREKNKGLSGKQLEKKYKEYAEKYQGDYDHFEMEIPMPDYVRKMIADKRGNIDSKYFNEDGSWNMDEIKKVVPESAMEAICYRIPTEAKYSIMVCKVKRFSKEGSGSTAKYPKELTEFTGSDFDIDTDFVELRPMPGSRSYDVDNEIFDLQLAALRSIYARQETFKRGDFSDLSEMSYRDVLLRNGYSLEEVNALSPKEAKELCKSVEDLDLMNPATDIILKNQNSDAGKMIGIAAVSVISHAFMSVYNELDIHETADKESGNFSRILISNTKENHSQFTIENDMDSEHVTERVFGGYVILDPMHDMDGNLISTQLSKYVGASADAAKDAALYRLNITQTTLPILAMMHRIGVSGVVARAFISQPVIRDVVRVLSSQSAFGSKSLEDAIETVLINITVNDKEFFENGEWSEKKVIAAWQDVKVSDNKKLKYSELMENKVHPEKQSVTDKMVQLHILLTMSGLSNSVRNLDSFSRYNSATAMKGSSFFARYAERKKIDRLHKNLNGKKPVILLPDNIERAEGYYGDNLGKLCTMFPHIAQVVFGEHDLMDRVILDNMHTYSINFFEAVEKLRLENPDQGSEKFVEKLNKLYTGWKNYLLFVGPNRIADFYNESTARKYTRNIATEFFDFMDNLEKTNKALYDDLNEHNEFIKSLSYEAAKDGYGEFFVISTDVAALSGVDVETYQRDWEAILDMPEMRTKGGASWATELAIHFLARGAAFARNTPVTRMPIRVKEALGTYTKAFEEADRYVMSDAEITNFIATFCLNNSSKEDGIVPYFYNSQNKKVGVVDLKDEKGRVVAHQLTFGSKYASQFMKWCSSVEDHLEFDVPVIAIHENGKSQLYKVQDNNVQVEGSGDSRTFTIIAYKTEPLGIPGQISEYVGFERDESIFKDPDQDAADPNQTGEKIDTSSVTEQEQAGGLQIEDMISNRGGSFISSSPFYSMPSSQLGTMAKDVMNANNGYLETRTHLRRAEKIINSLGMKLGGISRGADKASPEYIINVKPTTNKEDQHENARRAAAMISVLGNKMTTTKAKTYVTDGSENFSHVEFSIPIRKEAAMMKKNISLILSMAGSTYDVEFNNDTLELMITADVSGEDTSATMEAVNKAADYVLNVQAMLYEKGLASDANISYNTLMYDTITPEDAIEIIKNIKDEIQDTEQSDTEEDTELSTVRQRDNARNKVGIDNILDIAERRAKAENVTEQLRELFGERRFPMRNTESSYESGLFVDAVTDDLDTDMLESIKNLLYDRIVGQEKNDAFNVDKAVDNLIINTANWILANRPEEDAISMMKKSGISEENATSIIGTINDILEEMDIC